jgi:predicted RNA-binding Zn-ribbon protein involved in translation (DUF1610 family)
MTKPPALSVSVRARCLSCGGRSIVCLPGEPFNRFECPACGEVVPCEDGFARAQDFDSFSVVRRGVKGCRAVAGCLSCGSHVFYPLLVKAKPGQQLFDRGDCPRCGPVARLTPDTEIDNPRFRRAPGWPPLQRLGLARLATPPESRHSKT